MPCPPGGWPTIWGYARRRCTHHFATKEAILDAVADAIIAEVDLTMFDRRDWAAALTEWARAYRRALAAHPNAVPFLARGPARGWPAP